MYEEIIRLLYLLVDNLFIYYDYFSCRGYHITLTPLRLPVRFRQTFFMRITCSIVTYLLLKSKIVMMRLAMRFPPSCNGLITVKITSFISLCNTREI